MLSRLAPKVISLTNRHSATIFACGVTLLGSAACGPLFGTQRPSVGPAETFTPTPAASSTPIPAQPATLTPGPFALDLTPFPTATALPTMVLPTAAAFPPSFQVWDGLPTYPAESRPDFYFRLRYDPATWALATDQFGYPVLAIRGLTNCVIAPAVGRGLPLNATVSHEVRRIGAVTFQISAATVGGVKQFVTYAGGDGLIFTAFEVSFTDQADICLPAAEGVLGTLSSVPLIEATPVGNP